MVTIVRCTVLHPASVLRITRKCEDDVEDDLQLPRHHTYRACRQIDQRANFDRDYLCHYKNQEMRKGHLDKIENERNRLGDIEMKRNNHSPWI